jgi:hypothetical protein
MTEIFITKTLGKNPKKGGRPLSLKKIKIVLKLWLFEKSFKRFFFKRGKIIRRRKK